MKVWRGQKDPIPDPVEGPGAATLACTQYTCSGCGRVNYVHLHTFKPALRSSLAALDEVIRMFGQQIKIKCWSCQRNSSARLRSANHPQPFNRLDVALPSSMSPADVAELERLMGIDKPKGSA